MKFASLKPLHLYLICIGCFILSNIFAKSGMAILNYLFAGIGFVFFFLAVRKYFKKPKTR